MKRRICSPIWPPCARSWAANGMGARQVSRPILRCGIPVFSKHLAFPPDLADVSDQFLFGDEALGDEDIYEGLIQDDLSAQCLFSGYDSRCGDAFSHVKYLHVLSFIC